MQRRQRQPCKMEVVDGGGGDQGKGGDGDRHEGSSDGGGEGDLGETREGRRPRPQSKVLILNLTPSKGENVFLRFLNGGLRCAATRMDIG